MGSVISRPVQNRHDFVFLFDVSYGNPNGDPEADNFPRIDPETGHGLVTDVAIKRRVRNYIETRLGGARGYEIYVKDGSILNRSHRRAYEALSLTPEAKRLPDDEQQARSVTRWMCEHFFDVRTFGAVMATEVNAGQVRGPVQLTFGTSVDPITPLEITITRNAATNEKVAAGVRRTMGRKFVVPYGLYRAHGFVSPRLANDRSNGTGFSEADLAIFWDALRDMFEHDRSANRGEMAARALISFRHDNELGRAHAHDLFARVNVRRGADLRGPARKFVDYEVTVDGDALPKGITICRWL